MSNNNLNRELTFWAEAGIRDTTYELPSKDSPGSYSAQINRRGKRIRAARAVKSEQLSLFK